MARWVGIDGEEEEGGGAEKQVEANMTHSHNQQPVRSAAGSAAAPRPQEEEDDSISLSLPSLSWAGPGLAWPCTVRCSNMQHRATETMSQPYIVARVCLLREKKINFYVLYWTFDQMSEKVFRHE